MGTKPFVDNLLGIRDATVSTVVLLLPDMSGLELSTCEAALVDSDALLVSSFTGLRFEPAHAEFCRSLEGGISCFVSSEDRAV
jgi:hypothetical protein